MAIRRPPDTDGDDVADYVDNCPLIQNPDQSDCDGNGVGDRCEPWIDCDQNNALDVCECLENPSLDINRNSIPDACECLADLVISHEVNGADLGALLAFWGPVNPALPGADINTDGVVNGADLGYLLNAWGPCTN
jgi:hypothetical protein